MSCNYTLTWLAAAATPNIFKFRPEFNTGGRDARKADSLAQTFTPSSCKRHTISKPTQRASKSETRRNHRHIWRSHITERILFTETAPNPTHTHISDLPSILQLKTFKSLFKIRTYYMRCIDKTFKNIYKLYFE